MKLLSCCFLHSTLCNEILSQVSKNRFLPSTVSSADMLNDELKRRMTHSQGGLTPTAQRKGEGFSFCHRSSSFSFFPPFFVVPVLS